MNGVAGDLPGAAVTSQKNATQIGVVFDMKLPVGRLRPNNVGFFQEPQQETQFFGPLGLIVKYEQSGLHRLLSLQR